MDLVCAGAGGIRFYKQEDPSHFVDVTSKTRLAGSVINGEFTGAWAVDIDADGDLDILAAFSRGAASVLRNNGDGTFTLSIFSGVIGVKQFAWADLNGDGNPDASFIDGHDQLRIFTNERSGRFTETVAPSGGTGIRAIAAAMRVTGVFSICWQ